MARAVAAGALCAATAGCDPGLDYRPVGWTPVEQGYSRAFGTLRLELTGLGGLVGQRAAAPVLTVQNAADHPVVLDSAELRAGRRRYLPQQIGALPDLPVTIPARATEEVTLYFDFAPAVLSDALRPPVALRLRFTRGSGAQVLDIPMEEAKP